MPDSSKPWLLLFFVSKTLTTGGAFRIAHENNEDYYG